MTMKAEAVAVTATATPFMFNVLGMEAPALSMLVGLISVVLTRIMLVSNEPKTKQGWWYYNISLTILLTIIVFVTILDKKLGPGVSVVLGIGIGASGILVVDVAKKWVMSFFAAWGQAAGGRLDTQEEEKK